MNSTRLSIAVFVGSLLIFGSCNQNPNATVTEGSIHKVEVDSSKTGIVKVGGSLFSIPSPIQTALLIKESGTDYSVDLMNSPKNLPNYVLRESKALNLGVYGADLGYATIFGDNEAAVKYMKTVEKLSNDLEITGALDKNIIKRFTANIGNRDSMLILTSSFYRAGDSYLKNNDRGDIAALVLTGGWIEAAYFTSKAALGGNDKARTRLGEQRNAVENLNNVLSAYDSSATVQALLPDFKQLKALYGKLNYAYQYEKPQVYPDQKLTFINSSTAVSVSDSSLKAISNLIVSLRNKTAG